MFKRLFEKFKKLMLKESSPKSLALAMAIGVFFAFAPFFPLLTWLALGVAWLFRVSMPIAAIILNIINNPWTMIPIMVFDYLVGLWLFENLLGINLRPYDPSWVSWLNNKIMPYITQYLDIKDICFWYYMIGGLIVASTATLICYPVFKIVLRRWFERKSAHENYNHQ